MKAFIYSCLFLMAFCLNTFGAGFGDEMGISPFLNYKTIYTAHFRINYPVTTGMESTAQKVANLYEEAYGLLSTRLVWKPEHTIEVVLVDSSDAANGLTGTFGRFGMVLIMTPPEAYFSTAYFEDWLRLLVIHELTHYLNMDAHSGIFTLSRYLLGGVTLPNTLWPRWMLEGLAVYEETLLTRKGRGRSPYYEMILRTAVNEGRLGESNYYPIDRINGDAPWSPGGEAPYLFGYQLMNQIAKNSRGKQLTSDGLTGYPNSENGEYTLGVLSYRSSGRIPFLINGNLENVTGQDFYDFWNDWLFETKNRMTDSIKKLKINKITPYSIITPDSYSIFGATLSPSEKWLAFTQEHNEQGQGLYLFNTETKKTFRLGRKSLGSGLTFTPDEKFVIASSLHAVDTYSQYSDLVAYALNESEPTFITQGLRAKDPDLTTDNQGRLQLVFTITENQTVALAKAELIPTPNHSKPFKLGPIQILFSGSQHSRIDQPKWTKGNDTKAIIFGYAENGAGSEDLMILSQSPESVPQILIKNGAYNQFPQTAEGGALYFISDITGINNIWRMKWPQTPGISNPIEQVSNTISGLSFPAISHNESHAYAAIYETRGWSMAQIELAPIQKMQDAKSDLKPAAPELIPQSTAQTPNVKYTGDTYSPFDSLLPRYWSPAPFIGVQPDGFYLGGTLAGHDALDLHTYGGAAAYSTYTKRLDYLALYQNRQLGPTLSVQVSENADQFQTGSKGELDAYKTTKELTASLAYPLKYDWSKWTPEISFHAERSYIYEPILSNSVASLESRFVPYADINLNFSNAAASRFALFTERGRHTQLGLRSFTERGDQTYKTFFSNTEYWQIYGNSVLSPSLRVMHTSKLTSRDITNVLVKSGNQLIPSILPSSALNSFPLRGYPKTGFRAKSAAQLALNYKFPIWRIERGIGTNPIYVNNLSGITFFDNTLVSQAPSYEKNFFLSSVGAGVRLDSVLFYNWPIALSAEVQRGLMKTYGGQNNFIFSLDLGTLSL